MPMKSPRSKRPIRSTRFPKDWPRRTKRKSSASDARCGESTPRPSSGSTIRPHPRIGRLRRKRLDRSGEKVVPRLPQALEKDRGDWKENGIYQDSDRGNTDFQSCGQKRPAPQTIGRGRFAFGIFRRTFADKRVRMLPTSRKVVSSRNFHDGRAYSATVSRNRAGIAATVT